MNIKGLIRRPSSQALDHFWLARIDAAPLVLVRTFYGVVVFFWTVSLVPDFSTIYGENGINPSPDFQRWDVFSVFRYLDDEVLLGACLALLIASSLLVAFGQAVRISLVVTVFLQISFADYAYDWTFGADEVLRVLGIFLAIYAFVTPTRLQGTWPSSDGSYGRAVIWPLRLLQLQLALIYFTTALEKIRGPEWRDGSAVFHALEIQHLERFPAPAFVTDTRLIVMALTYGTLLIEFALPVLLYLPRTRRYAVVVAISLHLGFELFLELGFFGPAMIVGILAFVSPEDARRVLDLPGRLIGRARPALRPS